LAEIAVWAEKYRPQKLSEVINQKHVVERIKAFVKEKNIPNMLFAGPAGTGKTSLSLAIAHELYGKEWRQNVLEKNASDERGIDVIRGAIKDFARTKAIGEVPYKLVILDEADALTPEAQQALRRTMENFTSVTRFILICVSPDTKIILPDEREIIIDKFQKYLGQEIISIDAKTFSFKEDLAINYISLNPKILRKKSLRLITETGRELKATEDHLILTKEGWKKVGDIKAGDFVAIFPHLEGTGVEFNDGLIIDEEEFKEFLKEYEIRKGKLPIGVAKKFEELTTFDKEQIRENVVWLYNNFILNNKGLTKREMDIYKIISKSPLISRFEIQKAIGLSRQRVVQLLKNLEKKGYVKRVVDEKNSKIHRFLSLKKGAIILRNKMDIKHFIEKFFDISISYSTIKNLLKNGKVRGISTRIISDLKSKGLLPLKYSNPKIGAIARLTGFLFGDGHLAMEEGLLNFTGNEQVLKKVQDDLILLGYKPQKIKSQFIKTKDLKGRTIAGTTTFFNLSSVSLWNFFIYLGIPKGDKCKQSYDVPEWVRRGTRLVKREFLRAFFDSEMTTPRVKKHNFEALWFVQHKTKEHLQGGVKFVEQIKNLLKEFEVETSKIKVVPTGYKRKTGEKMMSILFVLKASNENLSKFFGRVGFFYDEEKRRMMRIGGEYLRYKQYLVEKRKAIAQKILMAISEGRTVSEIVKEFGCSRDFVSDRIKGKDVGTSYKQLKSFEEWIKEREIKNSELIWNEVERVEETELERVIDITCKNFHSFVANGFVSHNCNYSSKIIEPIQSRCAVFRFKALTEADVRKYIQRIVEGEKLKITEDGIKAIIEISEGDLRKVANLLQASSALGEKITEDVVYEVASQAKPTDVKEMLELVLKGKFEDARKKLQDMLLRQGLSGRDVIREIHKQIYSLPLTEEAKVQLVEKCGEYEFRISEGGDDLIQLTALLAQFLLFSKK